MKPKLTPTELLIKLTELKKKGFSDSHIQHIFLNRNKVNINSDEIHEKHKLIQQLKIGLECLNEERNEILKTISKKPTLKNTLLQQEVEIRKEIKLNENLIYLLHKIL